MGSSDRARGPETPDEPFGGWPAGWSVRHVTETGSTNADLVEAASAGAADRTVLFTDHQTSGRGRLDRTWSAPPGANLLVSVLFRVVPADPGDLTRRIGLAAVDAVKRAASVDATLKWPNDVMVDDRKLAGILAQRAAGGEVVVGLGLNVGWGPDGAARLGDAVTPAEVLRGVLAAYDDLPEDIGVRYRAVLSTLGRRIRVQFPDGELVGTAVDVEPDGRLVVVDEHSVTHRLSVGDVVHVRPA